MDIEIRSLKQIPEGYETNEETTFSLAPQPGDRATFLVMVIKKTPGEQRIIAEMCYVEDGIEIVDALRVSEVLAYQIQAAREGS